MRRRLGHRRWHRWVERRWGASTFPSEGGNGVGLGEEFQGAGFRAAHETFFVRVQVVVAGEVEPAVDEVKGELGGKVVFMGLGVGGGGIGGDADFAGDVEVGLALESDDVGGGGVVEEIGVELGLLGIGEDDEGELALGAATAESAGGGVEELDGAQDAWAGDAQARVAVGDDDFAHEV